MITIRLSGDDASFLSEQLLLQAAHVENELVRTDARSMQHDLAMDLEHLQALRAQIERARDEPEPVLEYAAGEQRPPDDS